MAANKAIAPVELPLPPGFRFHPTDEELVNSYLKRKILLEEVHDFIPVVDLYKCEPWELPDKSFSTSRHDPSTEGPKVEWYLFGPRDRKYTNGFRMNRATQDGHWKSTGKDRPVMHHHATIGMKKTLVYHLGRAPNSVRTGWVMHEYRLHHHDMPAMQDTYALCRVFKKNAMTPSPDVPGGIDTGMDDALMQFMPSSADVNIDDSWVQFVSDDAWYSTADANKDGSWMQFMPGDTDTNMDGSRMQFVSGGADTDKDGMQFVPDCANTDKDGIQSVPGGAETDKDGMQFISDDAWYSSADGTSSMGALIQTDMPELLS